MASVNKVIVVGNLGRDPETRTYHKVLELHGLEELGQKLHSLSVQGRWEDMREAVPLEAVAELAQTCRYDDLPSFLASHREYASRISVAPPSRTPEGFERAAELRRRVQALSLPGVPQGLEVAASASGAG